MSHTAICSAILMTVGAIFSLGCCCPGRFAPVGFRPPAVVVQPLQENPAELAHKKTAEEFQRLVAQQLGPNTWAGSLAPNAPVWAKIRQITAQRSYKTNASIGGPFANVPFDENHAAGGILIGFFAGEDDGNHVGFLQPIYLTAQAEQVGKAYGAIHRPVQCLKAKGGYALGGVNLPHRRHHRRSDARVHEGGRRTAQPGRQLHVGNPRRAGWRPDQLRQQRRPIDRHSRQNDGP